MSAWQGRARSGILELYGGRFLKQTDIDNNSYVVVITRDTATELLGRADAVGESIKLNGKSFLVIGVLDDSSSLTQGTASISGSDDSDSDSSERSSVQLEGYIPFSTMTRIADNVLDVTMFYASGTDKESLDPAKNALTELLLERFEQDEDAFSVADQFGDHGSHVECEQYHVSDDRRNCNDFSSGRRYWHYEYHAGICHRTNKRDRNP